MKKLLLSGLFFILSFSSISIGQTITSSGSGNWNSTTTWAGGVVPAAANDVVIANGHTVSINASPVTVASITVGQGTSGTLRFDNAASRALTVTGNVTVAAGGSFTVNQITTTGNTTLGSTTVSGVASTAGIVVGMVIGGTGIAAATTVTAFDATTITLSVAATASSTAPVDLSIGFDNTLVIGGNLLNNGTFDMTRASLTGSYTAGVCNVTFNKAGDQTISGSGTTTRFRYVTLDKAAVANKVICSINVSTSNTNITYVAGTWEQNAGRLTTTSGSLAIGSLTATAAALNIIGSGSLKIANSLNVYGSFLVNTTDSVIIGSGTHKIDLTYILGSSATFTKGTVLVNGKIASAALCKTTFNGANIIIDPKGFATAVPAGTDYAFRQTTGTGGINALTFTGGTVKILNPNSTTNSNPELAMSTSVAPVMSGAATFILGNGSSTVASAGGFKINLSSVNVLNNLTINTGTVGVVLQTNVTLNGILTITSSGPVSGAFKWTAPNYIFNGTTAQVTGSIMPASVKNVTINNPAGVTSSQELAITDTLRLISGTLSGPYTARVTVTGTDVKQEEGLPASFLLSQNFPNPFNPTTYITFSIPQSSFVTLKVYDTIGKEVATLVNNQKDAGNYKVSFDASELSSGVYLYKIQSGNFIQTKKMILIK